MRGLFRSYDARAKENLTASRSALFDNFLTISTGKSARGIQARSAPDRVIIHGVMRKGSTCPI
jgi:hypothetical protein